ncbi:MAG TPA: GNAT family N-acetyltransferase, partial [Longimicrobiaceae bacterium]|nr:GNAT family N-acetyltransferase [Longimicrobiaceae bacterium]
PALFAVFSDAEVMRYWSRGPMADVAEARALLDQIHACFAERSLFQWGVALRATDEVIGTCTLSSLNAAHRRAEAGYALGRRHWGHGYMGEALPLLLRFAFGTLGMHRIEADVDPRNARSIRSLQALGFRTEGLLRERYHVAGEIQDAQMMGLLRTEADPTLLG